MLSNKKFEEVKRYCHMLSKEEIETLHNEYALKDPWSHKKLRGARKDRVVSSILDALDYVNSEPAIKSLCKFLLVAVDAERYFLDADKAFDELNVGKYFNVKELLFR